MIICNYCALKRIKAKAKRRGQKITTKTGWNGGVDILVDGVLSVWLMELPPHCECKRRKNEEGVNK